MRLRRGIIVLLALVLVGPTLYGIHSNVWAAASANAGKLIITEVAFGITNGDWIELYVVDGSVDWTGHEVHKGGTLRFTIPQEWETNGLDTGDYIVLEQNGPIDTQKMDNNPNYWEGALSGGFVATDDVAQIKEASGGDRVDVVIWSDASGNFSQSTSEANGAVADGLWDNYDFTTGDAGAWTDSDSVGSSETIARYLDPGSPVYADSNSKANWYHETSPSKGGANSQTLITLVSFTATGCDGYVLLEWETASEVDNAGFNLWRSETEAGPYTRLNADLIPARGGPAFGARYSYVDEGVGDRGTYWYRLEDVDLYGVSTFHGPVGATARRLDRTYLPLVLKGKPL